MGKALTVGHDVRKRAVWIEEGGGVKPLETNIREAQGCASVSVRLDIDGRDGTARTSEAEAAVEEDVSLPLVYDAHRRAPSSLCVVSSGFWAGMG